MVDGSGEREFNFQQLVSAVKDCCDAAQLHASSRNRQVSIRLSNAAFDLQQRTLELGKMFRQLSQAEKLCIPDIVRHMCCWCRCQAKESWLCGTTKSSFPVQISIISQLVLNWDEQLQRILLTKMYQLLPDLTDQASLAEIKLIFRTIIMEQSQPRVCCLHRHLLHCAQTMLMVNDFC